VQIVAPLDAQMSHYGLQVVDVPRMTNMFELKGERFIFMAGRNVPFQEYSQSYETHDSFESARADFLKKNPFEPASPKLAWNGSYYRAMDFDSLYMLTAYYWFEQAADFFSSVVHDRSSATQTPVIVSVYGAFTSKGLIRVPIGFVDNSGYRALEDVFKMYRVGDQEGVPFEMNPGVVAHEVHHRIFHNLVFQSKGKAGYEVWKRFHDNKSSLTYARARVLLRATDEGMADIHAVAFSRNPNFLAMSQAFGDLKAIDAQRDLDGSFSTLATYDNLADSSIDTPYLTNCNGESLNYANTHWRYYCLGTVIAKTLWDASDNDIDVLRNEILPVLNQSFTVLGDALIEDFAKYDMDVLWRIVVGKLGSARKGKLCNQIQRRFQSLYGRIPECP
jgi:hypothetical protein